MKRFLIFVFAAALAVLLGGCATSADVGYYKALEASANAEAMRYTQLGEIGKSGDTVAKVVSSMALQGAGGGQARLQIAPPKSLADTMLQAAGIFVPSLVQAYGMRQQTILGQTQSNNAAGVAKSTNETFLGIAGLIQAPAANVTTTTVTTHTVGDFSGASSGNSGRIAGGDVTDSTHPPTVVTQPAPLVVTQPAPLVVNPIVVTP